MPDVNEFDWQQIEANVRIKVINVFDSKGRAVTFQRVQKDSSSYLSWYNSDYPVMDEYLDTWSLMLEYDSYSIVGFYPEGSQPPHVCSFKTIEKCEKCPKMPVKAKYASGVHMHVGYIEGKEK